MDVEFFFFDWRAPVHILEEEINIPLLHRRL
jgi:hypothetical protein